MDLWGAAILHAQGPRGGFRWDMLTDFIGLHPLLCQVVGQSSEGSPRVTAPRIDLTALRAASTSFPKFNERPDEQRRLMLLRLASTLEIYARSRLGISDPAFIVTYLREMYAPSTAVTYASIIGTERPELKTRSWMTQWHSLLRLQAETQPDSKGAIPATPEQIRRLIGDLSLPAQRAIFQAFVTASRMGETMGETTSCDLSKREPRTWRPYAWETHGIVQLHLRTHKGAPEGTRPYSKWVRLRAVFGGLPSWRPHLCTHAQLYAYIHRLYPDLGLHSFRKAAFQLLEGLQFTPTSIAKLTGHTLLNESGGARSYHASHPDQVEALEVMRMTDALQDLLLPGGQQDPRAVARAVALRA